MDTDGANWAEDILAGTPGFETAVFEKYAHRLLSFARSRLPDDLNSRVDEEDVVQSVFRTFFRRNRDGQFAFDDSYDVWHLLAAITYRKVANTVKHHRRDRRNSKLQEPLSAPDQEICLADRSPSPEELNVMFDYLRWILDQLPELQKTMLQLRMEGYSIAEIAEQVSLSQRSVKRGLAKVRELVVARNRMEESQTEMPESE